MTTLKNRRLQRRVEGVLRNGRGATEVPVSVSLAETAGDSLTLELEAEQPATRNRSIRVELTEAVAEDLAEALATE